MTDFEVVSFTASRTLPEGSREVIWAALQGVTAKTYVTGACIGGDQMIATLLAQHRPGCRQLIIVPRNRSRVELVWLSTFAQANKSVRVVYMPQGTTYRDRNQALLGERYPGVPALRPDLLVGFPLHAEKHPDSAYSGTWMTLRMAHKRLIIRRPYILGGDLDGRVAQDAALQT